MFHESGSTFNGGVLHGSPLKSVPSAWLVLFSGVCKGFSLWAVVFLCILLYYITIIFFVRTWEPKPFYSS